MKIPQAILPCALLLMTSASAQITIIAANFPEDGESMVVQFTESLVPWDAGNAGANQTWTIPELGFGNPLQIDWIDPAATPYAAEFPTANRCQVVDFGGDSAVGMAYDYQLIQVDGFFELGDATVTDEAAIVNIYDAPALAAPLPGTYDMNWTTVSHWEYEVIPGFVIVSTDSAISTTDAWGTITTPFGTFDCLRIFERRYSVAIWPPPHPGFSDSSVAYSWVINNPRVITAATFESEDGVVDPNFAEGYMTIGRMGIIETAQPHGPIAGNFSVGQNYPNPFNPTTSLPITLAQAGKVTVTVYNELGKIIASETRSFGPGNHRIDFDGSAWASGNYFAQVKAGGQLQTMRMTLLK
ncbi:T9SS type A sorting domain-containing protein [bacterium]|nr:T9SS type A sorting domain-containing protein [bacterium]